MIFHVNRVAHFESLHHTFKITWCVTGCVTSLLALHISNQRNEPHDKSSQNRPIIGYTILQHLYFNNKTSSAHSSSINASESLSDSSSLRIEFKMSFDWSSYWSVSLRGYLAINYIPSKSHVIVLLTDCMYFELWLPCRTCCDWVWVCFSNIFFIRNYSD